MTFNSAPPTVMHLDLNSCFASIEQQANPFLRGHPIVVAAYNSPRGCVLAASVEAKTLGIKTGFRVQQAKALCPRLLVLTPDPAKYRFIHLQLRSLLSEYTANFYPKSIDEFVLHFAGYPALNRGLPVVAQEIKHRIQAEVGDWLTVSIGIGPNRFLAKTASNFQKPDGLIQIDHTNFLTVYQALALTDLRGINTRLAARLHATGIHSVIDFYHANRFQLRSAFRSVLADYWYSRLRGWECDDVEFSRRTFGNSYALPHHDGSREALLPILQKLVEKTSARFRLAGFQATGIHLGLFFKSRRYWHKSKTFPHSLFDSRDLYRELVRLLASCPPLEPVHILSESCFGLVPIHTTQLELFENIPKKQALTQAIDNINHHWGHFTLTPARLLFAQDKVPDRIAFGGVREL